MSAKSKIIDAKTIGFSYGCISEKLEKQAHTQGFILDNADKFEKCREALITLRFNIDMPDSIYNKLTKRLHNYVIKNLKLKKNNS